MPELVDLLRDYEEVTRVITAFDAGGRIVAMSVASEHNPALGGTVSTRDMFYPQSMLDTVKTNLTTRRRTLAGELAKLGVTVPS